MTLGLCTEQLEGIAFSFVYGIKFIEDDNFNLASIKAGNDNLFQSKVFSQTISTLVGKEIQLYNTTGAIGASEHLLQILKT